MRWTIALVAGWAALYGAANIHHALPTGWWFEPGNIMIEDARVGECPNMIFDRAINRPFYGEWTVTVMRRTSTGGYATWLTYSGANDYRPDNSLPSDLDLCWWTWTPQLGVPPQDWVVPLPSGSYRVNTLWRVYPRRDETPREIRRSSPSFTVQPAA